MVMTLETGSVLLYDLGGQEAKEIQVLTIPNSTCL